MNIALINGPTQDGASFVREGRCTQKSSMWATQWPPVTLAYLAAIANQQGHVSRVFDCPATGTNASALFDTLKNFRPQLCVLAISTQTLAQDIALVQAAKKILPETTMAVLGTHATVMDREIIEQFAWVDAVIRNEPEQTFLEWMNAVAAGQSAQGIAGLTVRGPNGPVQNPPRPYLDDLDRLPFPAWETVDLRPYRLPFDRRPLLLLVPLRGCPYRCSFCTAGTYYGHTVRLRSVDSVVREIRRDTEQFGVSDFLMWAETFTIDREFVIDLSEAIVRDAPAIRWTCNSRTDTVDQDLLEKMREAGCWMVSFGFESGDDAILSAARKNLRSADPATPIRQAKKAGLKTLGHFILGLPGETPDTLRKTIDLALRADLDFAQFYTAAPFAGSPLFDQALENKWLTKTALSGVSQTQASLALAGLPPAVVDRARKKAMLRFYFRPRQMLRVLRITGFGLLRFALERIVGWVKGG